MAGSSPKSLESVSRTLSALRRRGPATSELVVKIGSEAFEFEFRGGDKAQRAYQLIMTELLQNEPS